MKLGDIYSTLSDIEKGVRRTQDLIQNLRSFLIEGKSDRSPVDLNVLIRRTAEFLNAERVDRGIRIILDLREPLPQIEGDVLQLQQLIQNLIVNAFDAVSDMIAERREVTIVSGAHGGRHVTFHVKDLGPGVDPSVFDKIFEPFVSTKSQGVGMGLTLCHAIVDAHSGRIWATRNPMGGAIFHVLLPSS